MEKGRMASKLKDTSSQQVGVFYYCLLISYHEWGGQAVLKAGSSEARLDSV